MITTINEFKFSKHYISDSDNRFKNRIVNAVILNKFQNQEKAEHRFKRAMYYLALEQLDKLAIALNPIAVTFGNIYFKENKRLILASIKIDYNDNGNIYVAVIKEQEVVTLLLYPSTYSNKDIADKLYQHDGMEIKQLRGIDGSQLSLEDKKRPNTIIDLDMSDDEFNKIYPIPKVKNNILTKSTGLSQIELDEITAQKNVIEKQTRFVSIPTEAKAFLDNKEYVIYDGMEILVQYTDGPKIKKIKKLIVDETGSSRKFSLEFENTLKPLDLTVGLSFIIQPKLNNDNYKKLIEIFNLTAGDNISFQGPIVKFNYYSKQKTGNIQKLGVIIEPRMYL